MSDLNPRVNAPIYHAPSTCRHLYRRLRLAAALFLLLSVVYTGGQPVLAQPTDDGGRRYPETGYTLAQPFVRFYDINGGLLQFGYPVTEARIEDGYLVQWTERQRLEYHPEHEGTEFEVLLGLLGRELTRGLEGPRFKSNVVGGTQSAQQIGSGGPQAESFTFKETGYRVEQPFLKYWRERGGLRIFGYPISNLYSEGDLQVQWFERVRMELHPENPADTLVLLGHLGYEALAARDNVPYKVDVHGTPAPDTNMEIGLAQGGESEDPGFFDNIRSHASALGPGLVRIDNVFSHYGIVQRDQDGLVYYDWSKFDRLLDGMRAMGKEPLICLSYMPEVLSVSGRSRVEPPANYEEWADLVRSTVHHVNVERKMGVRYWEVWNEPNIWDFWHAPYPEYLKLYDVTAEAALLADPSVKIGGPSVSYFSTDHIGEFLEHERWNVSMGLPARVDFISWHSYGRSPEQVAADIRQMRKILEEFPMFSPQIFITEFNVLQGGAGDTSSGGKTDTVESAIAFLSSIEGMQRERLDRAFLFELKDGQGPRSYWGRWGILTYDGKPKPIYHALAAYQNRPGGMLPVTINSGPQDTDLGIMAYGTPSRATIFVWYTGTEQAQVKVGLPSNFSDTDFNLTLFDTTHNNPARTGDPTLRQLDRRNAGDLVLELKSDSLVILTAD
ncbi:MAG: glycosyl hydrolase [Chloroflexia bacterium]